MKNKNFCRLVAALLCLAATNTAFGEEQSRWRTGKDGWVLRKAPGEKHYEKFFAVGLWNIPGYTKSAMEEDAALYRRNASPYLSQSSNYNAVYLSPGSDPVAGKRIEVTGSIAFHEALKAYQTTIPGISNGKDRDYQARQYMKNHAGSRDFTDMLDKAIDNVIRSSQAGDHIWAPIDEITGGGAGSGWGWSPEVGEKIRERIHKREPHTLIYTDLVGISRGNTFLFEQLYLKNHKAMPHDVPYEALGQGAKILPERPLLGFVQAYDGSPVYVNGTADYTDYDLPTLRRFFYENLKISARHFRKCSDVFGINSFIDCNTYPVLAGIAVDGIKAGAGKDTPVWIFFDGNGYAQPSHQNAAAFVQNLKCQIYTSIIHGATGIMFWNDRSLSPDVFNALEPVIEEVQQYAGHLFKAPTIACSYEGDIHYIIKETSDGSRTIIAANTHPQTPATLSYGSLHHQMKPYEVFIQKL